MEPLIPEIDEDVPLPASATLADLTPSEELEMRIRTIKLIADIKGDDLTPGPDNINQAEVLAREMVHNPKFRPEFAKYPNETMAYLAGMIAQTNCMLVDELSELKLYVVNKLVLEVEEAKDAKARIAALKALGEVDGVDAFKKRSEVTHKVQPIEEVEKELLSILDGVEYKVLDSSSESHAA